MTRPLVSVCIVTYNQEKYIEDCLNSVVNQSVDFDFEVIVSDDASTDRTPEIIKQFSERYPFVRLNLRDENVGAYINFVETHQLAKGELICHLDGDDYWLPGKLKTQTEFMLRNPACMISWHKMRVLYPDGRMLDTELDKFFVENNITQNLLAQYITIGLHGSKMYRSQALYENEPPFPIVDYFVNVEQLAHGFGRIIEGGPYGVYRAGIGIASDGSTTKNILSKSFTYFYSKYPSVRKSVTTAAMTLLFSAIKNKRFKDAKLFLSNVSNPFFFVSLVDFFKNYRRSRSLRLPK